MTERRRTPVARLGIVTLVVALILTVLPAGALAGSSPDSASKSTGGINIVPKFWVEPDGPYVPPPVTYERSEGRAVNAYGVLMGINAYPSSPLQGCISDITAVRDKLVNTYGWDTNNIHFITDAAVTPAKITSELQWLASVADTGSQTIFSFSGHGSPNTIYAYPMNGVSDSTVATELKKLKSTENICIFDSCYSGACSAVNIASPNFISMMACGAGETAADGNTFTKAWVTGLGQTTNGEVEDAFQTAYNAIQGWQHPVMWDNIAGKMMLGKKPPVISPPVPDLSGPEDTPITVTLTQYETDPADGHDLLKWTVSYWDVKAIKSITGQNSADDTLTFTPVKDYAAKTNITLVLSNSAGRSVKQNVWLTWTPVNDLPNISRLDKSWASVERTRSVKVIAYGADPDNPLNSLQLQMEYLPYGGTWTAVTDASQFVSNHWEVMFTPPATSMLGLADFRAKLKDAEGWGDWTTANALVEIRNALPAVTYINTSAYAVHRTQSLGIMAFGSDPETPHEQVKAEIEVKYTKDSTWSSLTGVAVDGDHWTGNFVPSVTATIGLYDIRARLKDGDSGTGDWKELDGIIQVKNALPVVQAVEFSNETVPRGESVTITIKGGDLEDPPSGLVCDLHMQAPSASWVRMDAVMLEDDHWEATFSPGQYAKLGSYGFRANLKDSTGQVSDWLFMNASVEVVNSLPTVTTLTYSKTSVLRTGNITLKVEGSDFEDKSSNLSCRVQFKTGSADWSDTYVKGIKYDEKSSSWGGVFNPPSTAEPGAYSFRASLQDKDGDWGEWFDSVQTVMVQNNKPVAKCVPVPEVVNEKADTQFDASASSDVEGNVEVTWDFGDGATADSALASHTYTAGGAKTVTLSVKDKTGETVTATFPLRVNLLPAPKATYKQSNGVSDFNVKFDASTSTDTEGGSLTYVWDYDITVDSNGDGKPDNDIDSSSPIPTYNYKKEGSFTAKLTVIDADNGTASTVIEVKTRSVSMDNNSMLYMALGIIIIGAVVGAAVYASRRKKKYDVVPKARPRSRQVETNASDDWGRAPAPYAQDSTMVAAPAYGASVATPSYYAEPAPSSGYQMYEPTPATYDTTPYGGTTDAPQEAVPEAPPEAAPVADEPPVQESPPEPASEPTPEPAPAPEPSKPAAHSDDISDILKRLDNITKK